MHTQHSGVCGILVQHAASALQLLGAQHRVPIWLVHAALLDAPAHCCASCLPAALSTCLTFA